MKETCPPITSRFGNEDGKSDIIRDGWTTEIICRKHTNNRQLTGGGAGACRGGGGMLSWMIALPTMVRGRGQPRASGMNVSPEITAAME